MLIVAVQELASVTITVYTPAGNPTTTVLVDGMAGQLYVNGAVPVVAETSMEPFDTPHVAGDTAGLTEIAVAGTNVIV